MSTGRGFTPAGGPWNGGIFEVGRGPWATPAARAAACDPWAGWAAAVPCGGVWAGRGAFPWAGATAGEAATASTAMTADRRNEDLGLMWMVRSLARVL